MPILYQSLHIHGDLLPEIAFDATLLFDHAANLTDVVFSQVLDSGVWTDPRRFEHTARPLRPNPKDVRQSHFDPFRPGKINSCDSCHKVCLFRSSALTLFVLWIGTQHPDNAAVLNNLGGIAYRQQDLDTALELYVAAYENAGSDRRGVIAGL